MKYESINYYFWTGPESQNSDSCLLDNPTQGNVYLHLVSLNNHECEIGAIEGNKS